MFRRRAPDANFFELIDVANTLNPSVENFLAGFKVGKTNAESCDLLLETFGIQKKNGARPFCFVPFDRISENL